MSGRRVTLIASALLLLARVTTDDHAFAAFDDGSDTDVEAPPAPLTPNAPERPARGSGGVSWGSTVEVYAGTGRLATRSQGSGSTPTGPACAYVLAFRGREPSDRDRDGVLEEGEYATPYRSMATGEYVDSPGAGIEMWVIEQCPPGEIFGTYRWVPSPQAVDIEALIAAAYERVKAQVPMPALNISPRPEVGVPAQLGIWLAVDDPGQLNVVAQVGPVWASATARFTSMSWAMGNGDVVDCAGLGTPYPDGSGTYEQGPCGYTYTRPGDEGVRQVTATAHWSVQLTTSTGRDEMLDPVARATTFDYEVYEVVTVVEG